MKIVAFEAHRCSRIPALIATEEHKRLTSSRHFFQSEDIALHLSRRNYKTWWLLSSKKRVS